MGSHAATSACACHLPKRAERAVGTMWAARVLGYRRTLVLRRRLLPCVVLGAVVAFVSCARASVTKELDPFATSLQYDYTPGSPLRIADIKNMGKVLTLRALRICPWHRGMLLATTHKLMHWCLPPSKPRHLWQGLHRQSVRLMY